MKAWEALGVDSTGMASAGGDSIDCERVEIQFDGYVVERCRTEGSLEACRGGDCWGAVLGVGVGRRWGLYIRMTDIYMRCSRVNLGSGSLAVSAGALAGNRPPMFRNAWTDPPLHGSDVETEGIGRLDMWVRGGNRAGLEK